MTVRAVGSVFSDERFKQVTSFVRIIGCVVRIFNETLYNQVNIFNILLILIVRFDRIMKII